VCRVHHFHTLIVVKSGNLNRLEPSGPVQNSNRNRFTCILGSRKGLKGRRISQVTLRYVILQARIIAKLYKVPFFVSLNIHNIKKISKYVEIKLHLKCNFSFFVCFWRDSPLWARSSSFRRLVDRTKRRTTFGRTPLDE
jgi:hypothetical protein